MIQIAAAGWWFVKHILYEYTCFSITPYLYGSVLNELIGFENQKAYKMIKDEEAVLSSFKKYTTFTFGGKTLTFRTCDGLERYTKILLWDHGYIEVMAKYKQYDNEIEEYIDLEPILTNLYMNKDLFLDPIKGVRIQYD